MCICAAAVVARKGISYLSILVIYSIIIIIIGQIYIYIMRIFILSIIMRIKCSVPQKPAMSLFKRIAPEAV